MKPIRDELLSNVPFNCKLRRYGEVFDYHAERVFGYMQVFSACCDSFAHGANDVANAMGPFAAIWSIYENGLSDKAEVPVWILVVGRCRLKPVFASTE